MTDWFTVALAGLAAGGLPFVVAKLNNAIARLTGFHEGIVRA